MYHIRLLFHPGKQLPHLVIHFMINRVQITVMICFPGAGHSKNHRLGEDKGAVRSRCTVATEVITDIEDH